MGNDGIKQSKDVSHSMSTKAPGDFSQCRPYHLFGDLFTKGVNGFTYKYAKLHILYLVRKLFRLVNPPEEGAFGSSQNAWWFWKEYPSKIRTRYHLRLFVSPSVPSERWVNSKLELFAWILLASVEPHWILMTQDGDDPWGLLRTLDEDEIINACERLAGDDDTMTQAILARRNQS